MFKVTNLNVSIGAVPIVRDYMIDDERAARASSSIAESRHVVRS